MSSATSFVHPDQLATSLDKTLESSTRQSSVLAEDDPVGKVQDSSLLRDWLVDGAKNEDLGADYIEHDSRADGESHEPLQTDTLAIPSKNPHQSSRFNKLQKKLRKLVSWAIRDYNMIEDGDVVMVCISGGKDSFTLLDILLFLQKIAPIRFEVVAVNLDQKQPNYPEHILPEYLEAHGIPYYILEKDTYSVVKQIIPEGKTYCSACSRLRRGSLYGFAKQIGATKVALGHHRDDMMATFFLNLFHGGSLKSMPPKLLSDDKQNILIRPLAYVSEKDIIKYARYKAFPIIPCNLCGSQENLQRAMINEMLREWDEKYPKRLDSIFGALQNVAPSQLADRSLFDFNSLTMQRDDTASIFSGQQIQSGQINESLQQKGMPIAPAVQAFVPEKSVSTPNKTVDQTINRQKIPTINPLV